MKDYSYVFNAHPQYIDDMYNKYINNPDSVETGWKVFFEGFEFSGKSGGSSLDGKASVFSDKEFGVLSIIHGFRTRGHLLSTTNPIRERRDRNAHLDLADYKLSESDLNQKFAAGSEIGIPHASLKQIIEKCRSIYAGNIGFEYAHIENREKRSWLRDKIENRLEIQ